MAQVSEVPQKKRQVGRDPPGVLSPVLCMLRESGALHGGAVNCSTCEWAKECIRCHEAQPGACSAAYEIRRLRLIELAAKSWACAGEDVAASILSGLGPDLKKVEL